MRHLALLVPLLVLCSCDAALSDAPASAPASAPVPHTANSSSSQAVLIESRRFKYTDSYDWNFRVENLNTREGVPVSFRTRTWTREDDETSRITMTPHQTGGFAFQSSWSGYDHPNAWVYPVVLDPGSPDGLRVEARFNALGYADNSTNTSSSARSYHNTPRGVVIDYVDSDGGGAIQPTSVTVPGTGRVIDDVAYLVYVPKGERSVPNQRPDLVVDVYGPQGTTLVTESVGDGELPRIVQGLLQPNE